MADADAGVIQRPSFGGDSVMVWACMLNRMWQDTISCCRRNSDRYRDEIVQLYVFPFIHTQSQQRHILTGQL